MTDPADASDPWLRALAVLGCPEGRSAWRARQIEAGLADPPFVRVITFEELADVELDREATVRVALALLEGKRPGPKEREAIAIARAWLAEPTLRRRAPKGERLSLAFVAAAAPSRVKTPELAGALAEHWPRAKSPGARATREALWAWARSPTRGASEPPMGLIRPWPRARIHLGGEVYEATLLREDERHVVFRAPGLGRAHLPKLGLKIERL